MPKDEAMLRTVSSRIILHEIDHIDGKLITDIAEAT